jgi:hypothetical protein
MGCGGSTSKPKSAINRSSPKTDVLKETDEDPVSTLFPKTGKCEDENFKEF